MIDIYEYYKKIKDINDFKKFLELLKTDYINNRKAWENDDLESYLEGLFGYIYNDQDVNIQSTWKKFAEMLLAAKVYE